MAKPLDHIAADPPSPPAAPFRMIDRETSELIDTYREALRQERIAALRMYEARRELEEREADLDAASERSRRAFSALRGRLSPPEGVDLDFFEGIG